MKEKKPVGPHKLLKICRRLFFSGALTMLTTAYLIGESYQWRVNDVSVFLSVAGKRCIGIPLDRGRCWNPDQGRKPSDRLFEATLSLLRRVPDGRRPDAVQPAPFLPGLRKNAG